jgi:hypothetical protein
MILLVLVLFVASCSSGGMGCSGCAQSCGGNPNYKFRGTPLKDGVHTRLTQNGVDFLSQHLTPIIEGVLQKAGQSLACSGPGITFPAQRLGNGPKDAQGNLANPTAQNCGIDATLIPPKAKCTGNTPPDTWFVAAFQQSSVCGSLARQSVSMQLNESDNSVTIKFNIPEARVRSNSPDLGFCYKGDIPSNPVVGGQYCVGLKVELSTLELILKDLAGTIKMRFVSNPQTGKVGLQVAPNGIQFSTSTKFTVNTTGCKSVKLPINIPVVNYTFEINLGSQFCTYVVDGLTTIVNSTSFLQPLIFGLLGNVIANQLQSMDLLADAKVEMELPLANLMGGLGLPGMSSAQPLGMLLQPGNTVGVRNGGLSLSFDSGFEVIPAHACVPLQPTPTVQPGPAPAMIGNYHLAASLSKAATDLALWAAYHTGSLCIKLDSSDINRMAGSSGFVLNAGIFALLAPDLTKVAPSSAPVMLSFQPMKAPQATFGTGQKINGKTDSTIRLMLPDFGVSFYVMLHDRYVRIFKLIVDVKLGISLIATPTNDLEIAIDMDTLEVLNPRSAHAYLVKTADVSQLVQVIVNILVQTLGNNKLSFPIDISKQLSAALGVPIGLKINGIDREGAANDWLSLKMTLTTQAHPQMPEPRTIARLRHPDPGLLKRDGDNLLPTGEVFLEVPADLAGLELEYQYYVNFGGWSNFYTAPGGVLRVQDPTLKLLGQHTIYLRGRIKGEYHTLERYPTSVRFSFDPLAPDVEISLHKDRIHIAASDQVSDTNDLRYFYRVDERWVPIRRPEIALSAQMRDRDMIDVRVQDRAGNARIVRWSIQNQKQISSSTHSAPSEMSAPVAWGCAASDSSPHHGLWWLLIFLLLPFIRRIAR